MRYIEINEGGASGNKRYNSEIGFVYGYTQTPIHSNEISKWAIPDSIENTKKFKIDLEKFLQKNLDQAMFDKWVNLGSIYYQKINKKLKTLDYPDVTQISWSGGDNSGDSGVDIGFSNHPIAGVSIKEEGGITLANLSETSLGLDKDRGFDIFYKYAQTEWQEWKTKAALLVLEKAKKQPNVKFSPIKDKYNITYSADENKFVFSIDNTVYKKTEKEIINELDKNRDYQRVFGDFLQKNKKLFSNETINLYKKIGNTFEKIIESYLNSNINNLAKLLRFIDKPYFYATPNEIYFVPSISQVNDLKLKKLFYDINDNTAFKFSAGIGRRDSDKLCLIDVYIRYANGIFATNPTVRIQNIKNPENILWDKI